MICIGIYIFRERERKRKRGRRGGKIGFLVGSY
jgi:hypothetical protein